jgi:hypothetical protein
MNTYTKVKSMSVPATHPLWGNVTIVSKWRNSRGQELHQVRVATEAGFVRLFSVMRFTSLLKGGE